MKKIIALALTVILAIGLFACSTPKAPTPTATPEATEEPGETSTIGKFTADDFCFEIDGKKFTFKGKQEALINDFASVNVKTYQMEEAASCMFSGNGKDVTITYDDGFQVFTFPAEPCETKDNTVDEIFVYSDKAVFKNGIKLGATKEKVIEAYGDKFFTDGDDCMIYNEKNNPDVRDSEPSLRFYFEEGVVAAVDLVAGLYKSAG